MKRAAIVLGTRPEAIKLAPVYRALKERGAIVPFLIVSGQHQELLRSALDAFGLKPDVDLALMLPDQKLDEFLAKAVIAIGAAFDESRPDVVIVQGDTTTVLAASLAAFYRRTAVAHVEAGLRTNDMGSPFPEEMNRVLAGRLARWHFAPTDGARDNLVREGIAPSTIHVVGNTVIDSLLATRAKVAGSAPLFHDAGGGPNLLVTTHRRENFGHSLTQICDALITLHDERPDIAILLPVHLNPNVASVVRERLAGRPRIKLSPPLDYPAFVAAMDQACLILSDSGGVQEEAPSLNKPVLVMRESSERPEAIAAGAARLVGADAQGIVDAVNRLLDDRDAYAAMAMAANPFGDGSAGARIADVLAREIGGGSPT